jgi:hypothetical protein
MQAKEAIFTPIKPSKSKKYLPLRLGLGHQKAPAKRKAHA